MKASKQAKILARIFRDNGWTWHDSPEPPKAKRIDEMIAGLMEDVGEDAVTAYSGRLMVRWNEDYHEAEVYLCIPHELDP